MLYCTLSSKERSSTFDSSTREWLPISELAHVEVLSPERQSKLRQAYSKMLSTDEDKKFSAQCMKGTCPDAPISHSYSALCSEHRKCYYLLMSSHVPSLRKASAISRPSSLPGTGTIREFLGDGQPKQ
jgi:hypothetical protein